MSYHALLGAFPIAAQGDSLDPKPNEVVGALHGSSRNGAFFLAIGELLDRFPSHESLRFLAPEPSVPPQPDSDGTRWTLLDAKTMPPVIAALDSLLGACAENAAALAHADFFMFRDLSAAQIRTCLTAATICEDVNVGTVQGEDGDSPEFLFAALLSLCALLRRAQTHAERVAIFTWQPS